MKKLYKKLESMNISKVVVSYEGGDDDGSITGITYFDNSNNNVSLSTDDPMVEALEKELSNPIYDKYGSFCGDFFVNGTLTYNVSEQKELWDEDLDYEEEEEEEEEEDEEDEDEWN